MSHTHWPNDTLPSGGPAPVCPHRTKAACDKAFAAWDDDRYVALAGTADLAWHKDRSPDAVMYTQVVQVLVGVRDDLQAKGGHANMSAAAKRLRAAIERYRASAPVTQEG